MNYHKRLELLDRMIYCKYMIDALYLDGTINRYTTLSLLLEYRTLLIMYNVIFHD